MFLPFENISSESRIWIFSSSIKISEDSQKDISERIIKFLNSWKHHGVDLPCSFKILDAFLLLSLLIKVTIVLEVAQLIKCLIVFLILINNLIYLYWIDQKCIFLLITKFYAIRWRKLMLNFLITCFLIKLLIKKNSLMTG